MIQRKQTQRLGYNGPAEVKMHPWLRDFDWNALYMKQPKPTFQPNPNADNFDKRHINKEEENPDVNNPFLIRRNSIQRIFFVDIKKELFAGYDHDNSDYLRKEMEGNLYLQSSVSSVLPKYENTT